MTLLRAKLYEIELEKQSDLIYGLRKAQVGTGSRSEKIRTYNWKDSRCTDHRLNQNFPLQSVMSADLLEEIHNKCVADDQQSAMKAMLENNQK